MRDMIYYIYVYAVTWLALDAALSKAFSSFKYCSHANPQHMSEKKGKNVLNHTVSHTSRTPLDIYTCLSVAIYRDACVHTHRPVSTHPLRLPPHSCLLPSAFRYQGAHILDHRSQDSSKSKYNTRSRANAQCTWPAYIYICIYIYMLPSSDDELRTSFPLASASGLTLGMCNASHQHRRGSKVESGWVLWWVYEWVWVGSWRWWLRNSTQELRYAVRTVMMTTRPGNTYT